MEAARNRQLSSGQMPGTDRALRLQSRPGAQTLLKNAKLLNDPMSSSSLSINAKDYTKKSKGPTRSFDTSDDHDDVSSDDQLNSLAGSSPAKSKKPPKEYRLDADGKKHEVLDWATKTKNLKALNFKKNKSLSSTSRGSTSETPEIIDLEDGGQSSQNRAKEGKMVERMKPNAASLKSSKPKPSAARPRSPPSPEPTPPPTKQRPRPRPKAKAAKESPSEKRRSLSPDSSVEFVKESTRIPAAAPFPMDKSTPRRPSQGTSSRTHAKASQNLKPAAFPLISPQRASSITPPPEVPQDKKRKALAKVGLAGSTSDSDNHSSDDDTPRRKRGNNKKRTKKPAPAQFPMPLKPYGSSSSKTSSVVLKGKRGNVVGTETETEDEGLKAQPFPMATQLGSPSPGPSFKPRKKRDSSGYLSEESSPRKKTRADDIMLDDDGYVEESSFFMSATTDPKTLCPYCDSPLPPTPSPTLLGLLETIAKKSFPDPRPANPLGRKAPFTTYISLCQRHRFESDILPEAEAKGWPKVIDWKGLARRIQRMKVDMQELIDDDGGEGGPKSKCAAWKEIMQVVKEKGSRAATGVKDQFMNFEKTQPGYYGELGSFIIHQTLYDIFPPASINLTSIHPLGAEEFLQRVLLPEVALRLIIQDRQLAGHTDKGRRQALQILRESSAYGVAMFPADSSHSNSKRSAGGEGGNGREGLSAGETIIMERARKRRKEIEEEDRREEEEEEERKRLEAEKPKLKPRPRPIMKGASSKSLMDVDDVGGKSDGEGQVGADVAAHYDTDPMDTDVVELVRSQESDMAGASELGRGRKVKARPLAKHTLQKPESNIRSRSPSIMLQDAKNRQSIDTKEKVKEKKVDRSRSRSRTSRASSPVSCVIEVDDSDNEDRHDFKTPKAIKLKAKLQDGDDNPTPRPTKAKAKAQPFPMSTPPPLSSSMDDIPPLERVRLREEAKKKSLLQSQSSKSVGKGVEDPVNWSHSMRSDVLDLSSEGEGEEDSRRLFGPKKSKGLEKEKKAGKGNGKKRCGPTDVGGGATSPAEAEDMSWLMHSSSSQSSSTGERKAGGSRRGKR